MNNQDIAVAIAAAHGVSQKDAKAYVDTAVNAISDALKRGDEVSLNGFGKFKVKDMPARQGRNPQTGAVVEIAASKKAAFSASKTLKNKLAS